MKPVVESLHDVGVGGVLESWEFWVMAGGGLKRSRCANRNCFLANTAKPFADPSLAQ